MRRAVPLALALLAGCEAMQPVRPVPVPPPRPTNLAPPTAAAPPTALSAETAAYYTRVQASFLAQGLLRTDGGRHDAPFDVDKVVQSFLDIAFYEEYADRGTRLVAQPTASRLQRWEQPVRMRIVFGPGVAPAQAAKDRATIAAYAARLARLTGHPVSVSGNSGNFTILILTEDERRAYGDRLARLIPGLSPATRDAILNMDPSTYCLVVARAAPGTDVYAQAVAVIRAEHPDLLRLSCVHEELAQGMGLPNDSPAARPSIFNDDEEFALLTPMDAIMLRILYDPRLRPGMTEAEARPIVRRIAQELMGGPA